MIHKLTRAALWIVGAAIALFLGYSSSFPVLMQAGVACHGYNTSVAVPEGYGAAYNVLSTARELLLQVHCDQNSAEFTVGNGSENTYAYRYGYEWKNGAWQRITLIGSNAANEDWWKGEARATLIASDTTQYVVGYTCQWQNERWKCGCRDQQCATSYWQLQGYKKPAAVLPNQADIFNKSTEFIAGYFSHDTAPAGTTITLYGSGLTNQVKLRFGSTIVSPGSVQNGTAAWFTLPTITPGVYLVEVEQGEKKREFPIHFAVTKAGSAVPEVHSVSPERGPANTEVIITGKNFAPTGNYVMSTFAAIGNLSSADGKTLRVKLPSFPRNPELLGSPENKNTGTYWPVGIKVLNENGVTTNHLTFLMQL